MSFVAIVHGWHRGEEVVHHELLPVCALCLLCWSGMCAVCWCGVPDPWSASHAPCYLANSSIYQNDLPQSFFPWLPYFN